MWRWCLAGGLLLPILSSVALGEDCAAPCAGYEITTELQNDWIFAADPGRLKSDILQPTVTADIFFRPVQPLKAVASIITEPVIDPLPGETQIFEDIGTYVGELYAVAELPPVMLRAGKFDTVFSLVSEQAPGINATELASDIDADERLGAELTLAFDAWGLDHALAASAFTTDRSFLAGSLFARRPRTRLTDGGAGNTGGISSVSLLLTGCQDAAPASCYDDGRLGYRLGYRHQRAGEGIDADDPAGDEDAFLAAIFKRIDLGGQTLRLLAEALYARNFEGEADDALFLTAAAALDVGRMRYVATYTRQRDLIAGEPDTRRHLADLEILYASEDDTPFAGARWEWGGAYTYFRDDEGEDAHLFSLRATFVFGGSVALAR